MTNTTTNNTNNTTSELLTLRGALNALTEHVFDAEQHCYVPAVSSVTDERFVISRATRVEHVDALHIASINYTMAAHEREVGGYEVYDRETSAVSFVEYTSDGAHIAQLEQLVKTRGAKARRWRRRDH